MERNSKKDPRDKYQGLSFIERQAIRKAESIGRTLQDKSNRGGKVGAFLADFFDLEMEQEEKRPISAKNQADSLKLKKKKMKLEGKTSQSSMNEERSSLENSIETDQTQLSTPTLQDVADVLASHLASLSEHTAETEGGESPLYDRGDATLYGEALEKMAKPPEISEDKNYAISDETHSSKRIAIVRQAMFLSEVLKRPADRRRERHERLLRRRGQRVQ